MRYSYSREPQPSTKGQLGVKAAATGQSSCCCNPCQEIETAHLCVIGPGISKKWENETRIYENVWADSQTCKPAPPRGAVSERDRIAVKVFSIEMLKFLETFISHNKLNVKLIDWPMMTVP